VSLRSIGLYNLAAGLLTFSKGFLLDVVNNGTFTSSKSLLESLCFGLGFLPLTSIPRVVLAAGSKKVGYP